ncbi:hypothetical protein CTAYLR_009424 [Chrysophaeum taylorii]|uniref:Splicing factor YJU2 n=1 Tax=Chrysophaeum taylorii TaxID=2483200 RepID=A0AAD7UI96_9STRA|nr:hypothetical protein CTAYLR_009424 [Chrysophaeum taylorii]
MGERKVLNRYFPPDFDPLLVPKRKWDPYKQVEVRMMIPFSLQCNKCGEFMYRGKKFNSRKEDVMGDDYLGVRKYRFYIKCSVCSNEIAFKTDPQNNDYVCESGATRNFEIWKKGEECEKEEEEEGNAMAALESRTLDSKMEMDILDALDEIKAVNQRRARLERDATLTSREEEIDEDDVAAFKRDQQQLRDEVSADHVRVVPDRSKRPGDDAAALVVKRRHKEPPASALVAYTSTSGDDA